MCSGDGLLGLGVGIIKSSAHGLHLGIQVLQLLLEGTGVDLHLGELIARDVKALAEGLDGGGIVAGAHRVLFQGSDLVDQ